MNRSHEILGGSGWQPVAVAVDWIADNIYVCDARKFIYANVYFWVE